jgi:hypothetical protein
MAAWGVTQEREGASGDAGSPFADYSQMFVSMYKTLNPKTSKISHPHPFHKFFDPHQ